MVSSSDSPRGDPFAPARRCILVVEDELLIRLMISEELRDAGYDVIEAYNADEALAVLQSRVRVDLVFSDVLMPGAINGLGLLAVVRTSSPTLPVIITSGHLEPAEALANGASDFIAKPYLLETVLGAVHDELAKSDDC